MATTPVDNPNGFKPVRCLYNCPPPIAEVLATNSQTIVVGDPLTNETAPGYAAIAATTSGQILGVSTEDVTTDGSGTQYFKIWVACEGTIFEGQVSGTFAQADVHTSVDIDGSTGIFEVDETNTTEQVVRIVDYNRNDTIGANTRVHFILCRSGYTDNRVAET